MIKPILITAEGLETKKNELIALEKSREIAVKELDEARQQGDRSENAAYKSARWKLSGIDRQLRYLRQIMRRAKITERRNSGAVEIGATITVLVDDNEQKYQIVGSEESDIVNGKLSFFSPMGKALLGKKVGDICHVVTPKGKIEVKIVSVT